jgi:hypothetical protein
MTVEIGPSVYVSKTLLANQRFKLWFDSNLIKEILLRR